MNKRPSESQRVVMSPPPEPPPEQSPDPPAEQPEWLRRAMRPEVQALVAQMCAPKNRAASAVTKADPAPEPEPTPLPPRAFTPITRAVARPMHARQPALSSLVFAGLNVDRAADQIGLVRGGNTSTLLSKVKTFILVCEASSQLAQATTATDLDTAKQNIRSVKLYRDVLRVAVLAIDTGLADVERALGLGEEA
jgi:hypothetical protein